MTKWYIWQPAIPCIAHDRRGQADRANLGMATTMDTYAPDDLAIPSMSLTTEGTRSMWATPRAAAKSPAIIVRHGNKRVAKAVQIGAVPPLMLKTAGNPVPSDEVFDGIRAGVLADRSQFFKDLTTPFYGANRPNAKVSQGLRDSFWLQGMMAGFKSVIDCIKAFSETDFTKDLEKMDVPTLILHGDDDQIVPIAASSLLSAKLIKGATLKVYPGAPHGICSTLKNQVNEDLLTFIKG